MSMVRVGTESASPIELYYTDYGTGRPVVMIHGWPLSGRAWEAQLEPLVAAGYRVICYDRRGFGRSSQPWSGYEYDTLADDLAALLQHLNLTDVALVGFSMGGGEVVRYLSRHGADRVSRIVLAGAVPTSLLNTADNQEGALDDAFITGFVQAVRTDRMTFLDNFTRNFFSANGELKVSEPQRQYALGVAAEASAKGTIDCITAWGTTDFREDVRSLSLPTLVLHGDSDAIVPFEVSGKRTGEMVDGAEVVVVAGAPHGFNLSHADQFNAALLDFLAR